MNRDKIKLVVLTAAVTMMASNASYLLKQVPATLIPAAQAAGAKGGKHPMLESCLAKLQATQKTLQNALNLYGKKDPVGGHRQKALDDVNDAIKEIQAGIAMP